MTVNKLANLWVGYNETANFTVLICALDEQEAHKIADSYILASRMEGKFEINQFDDVNTHFDYDYVLMSGE